jgi:hypothetical protein
MILTHSALTAIFILMYLDTSRHSDWLQAVRPKGQSLGPFRGNIFFSPRRPERFLGPHTLDRGEVTFTPWTGCWVGSRASMDTVQ